MRARHPLSLTLAAVTLLMASACGGRQGPRYLSTRGPEGSRQIRVEVVNDNFLDMGVFVMEGSMNFRLGDVTGKSSATFSLDLDMISPSQGLRLLADPVGSRDAYLSDPVTVNPGTIVVFNIAPALSQSYVTLR